MKQRISRWLPIVAGVGLGALYEGAVFLGSSGLPLRIPIPYAVPIFDPPFALAAAAVGYLCLERHRLRQDGRSAGMGTTPGEGATRNSLTYADRDSYYWCTWLRRSLHRSWVSHAVALPRARLRAEGDHEGI